MIIKETRVKEYITPIRIVETNGDIKNSEVLTGVFEAQNFFKTDLCTVKGKGYIILDFGKEIYGTIRIQTNRFSDEKKKQ